MNSAVEAKVIAVLSQVMNLEPGNVHIDSSTDTIESWDSLQHMNLIMALEEEFAIRFSEDQIISEMLSVRQIVELITSDQES